MMRFFFAAFVFVVCGCGDEGVDYIESKGVSDNRCPQRFYIYDINKE